MENELSDKHKSEFQETSIFSATTDMWTSVNGDLFVSFTVNYIDENWVYHTRTISCSLIDGRHTGSELAKFVLKVGREYNIEHKIVFMTTDEVRNTCRLFNISEAE